ncbi:RTA1 like protein-domain-containing protein [Mucidula mucida]|nr:RTA1 like protein-domain-containing protein [Mucidula mucida]
MADDSDNFQLYRYTPSVVAAAIFAVIFFGAGVVHGVQIIRTKGWYFTAMLIGTLSMFSFFSLGPYILQSLLILLAPALFAASIYVVLGRVIVSLDAQRLSLIRVNWLTKFFVTGDVLSFLIQAAGGGLMAQSGSEDLGKTVVMIGLAVQVVWFSSFVIVSTVFHLRMRRYQVPSRQTRWTHLMYLLYIASALILIRSVFRIIEFSGGNDGVLMRNEVWLYVFDAALMTIVVVLFNVFHPPAFLKEMSQYTEALVLKERLTAGY